MFQAKRLLEDKSTIYERKVRWIIVENRYCFIIGKQSCSLNYSFIYRSYKEQRMSHVKTEDQGAE